MLCHASAAATTRPARQPHGDHLSGPTLKTPFTPKLEWLRSRFLNLQIHLFVAALCFRSVQPIALPEHLAEDVAGCMECHARADSAGARAQPAEHERREEHG
jgi:hypothetical protein